MSRIYSTAILLLIGCMLISGCGKTPQNAAELVSFSLEAHGGEALKSWKTMKADGIVKTMDTNIWFDAAYSLLAEKPGKLRVEEDLTADNGRLFSTYFLNNGTGWMQRNLIPRSNPNYTKSHTRIYNQLSGIAYYADHAFFTTKEDGDVDGKSAFVLEAVVDADTTMLFFDKKNFRLVQEKFGNKTRTHKEFKNFGGVVLPVVTHELTVRGERKSEKTFTISSVEFDVGIDPELFTEDMPKLAQK